MDVYIVNFDLFNGMYLEKDVNCIIKCNTINEAMDFVRDYYSSDKEYRIKIKSCGLWNEDEFMITSAKLYKFSEEM